ncbi:Small nuclear ribonucleoprotein (snRNP) [Pseudoloma neurophilia]|uniref:Small nuclear ribonucleoprotein (SnRNP) n=1 Tax=Pseudoloma neurophilia TaxID=146866 RepID=A0A0R0LX77_9MICR|nr:Small nuclear ribonucleoprotein (snRNP) [Pseudoloma neurophilia]
MYPVTLIRISKNQTLSIEMKTDEIYTGTLVSCDLYMNLHLRNVKFTDSTPEKKETTFQECVLRGNLVKRIRLNNKILFVQNIVERRKRTE